MKRAIMYVAALLMMVGMLAGPAAAHEENAGPPRHGHILLLHIEYDSGEPVGYGKCVDIASNRALPLHVHHGTIHTGNAGQALLGAGHMVAPTAPLAPWENCAQFAQIVGPPSR